MNNIIKIIGTVISILAVLSIYSFAINKLENAEDIITGRWAEKQWEYEKVYYKEHKDWMKYSSSSGSSDKDIILHMAEEWVFEKGGLLILSKEEQMIQAHWAVKGRGNILEIKYKDGRNEKYNITHICADKMILNFSSELQVKGITKLTFERIQPCLENTAATEH